MSDAMIDGSCSPEFAGVREAFAPSPLLQSSNSWFGIFRVFCVFRGRRAKFEIRESTSLGTNQGSEGLDRWDGFFFLR